jgi:hypothetical protein
MTRKLHDQFSKAFLGDLLVHAGSVQPGYTLSSEVKEIDILFQPGSNAIDALQSLGLLGRMASTFCLIEPYRNPIRAGDVRVCVNKVLEICNQQEREAKQQKIPLKQVTLPRLWILSPTTSAALMESLRAQPQPEWGAGIYFLAEPLLTAIVALHQLPPTLDTMWLRLLGRGAVQAEAISELMALSTAHAFRKVTLQHLAKLQLIMKTRQKKLSKHEQELIENLNPVYEAWERETIEKGKQEGRQEGRQEGLERGREEERQLMLSRTVPVLLRVGLSIDQIAAQLQVGVEAVRQVAQNL